MAVKQKVLDRVELSATEARLQIILRALQDITSNGEVQDKCAQIVINLGSVYVPSDPKSYVKFVDDIKKIRNILEHEISSSELVFKALKTFHDEIVKENKKLSPVMSIVLQLIPAKQLPNAVKFILDNSNERGLEQALKTLCGWLTKWTFTENLAPLVLQFMEDLELAHQEEILYNVTLMKIEPLFRLLNLPDSRERICPVVNFMLTRVRSYYVFHKIIPDIPRVLQNLATENSESSLRMLQQIVTLCSALMKVYPGYGELYEPLEKELGAYWSSPGTESKIEVKESWGIGKVGLNNLGNTCYMNSVLQALFITKGFRNGVLETGFVGELFDKLKVLFGLLQFSKREALSPRDILALSRPPGFVPGHQHDSSEFLGYLLDSLHEQEAGGNKDAASSVTTVVQNSFGGKLVTVSRCKECLTSSERTDNFRDLQLSFPNDPEEQTVQSLLDYYLEPEKLIGENQYHCDVCNRLADAEQVTRIVKAPKRLILTLKHFRYDPASQQRTKILQKVLLDKHIALNGIGYELYAVVVHFGSSVDSGHYYTFAKDEEGWYKFNDCSVGKSSAEALFQLKALETPYILFYKRAGCAEPQDLGFAQLEPALKAALSKDNMDFESEVKRKVLSFSKQNRRDDPPPPGCGGGGFSANNSNMFVC